MQDLTPADSRSQPQPHTIYQPIIKRLPFFCASIIMLGIAAAAHTQEFETTTLVDTTAQSLLDQSTEWQLTTTEWERYQVLMKGKRGTWSPGLDPLTALGASATSQTERRRYAELYVRAEFERIRLELAFQLEIDQAWKRLYPNTPRLATKSQTLTPVIRYAVIVTADCDSCRAMVQEKLKTDVAVDVHVVGTGGDDAALRAWVESNSWLKPALRSKQATINHSSGFADLSQYPAVYSKTEATPWEREL